jgi:hypothetical protein
MKKRTLIIDLVLIFIAIFGILIYSKFIPKYKYTKAFNKILKEYKPEPPIYQLFDLKVNKYSIGEYNNYEVIGEVKNISIETFKFVEVKAIFYDSQNRIVGEDTTYACGQDFILPMGIKSFKFMGDNQRDYKTVHCEIIHYTKVD